MKPGAGSGGGQGKRRANEHGQAPHQNSMDVITEVNRHPVRSAADVQKELSSVPKGEDALVLVWSNGGTTFRVLHPTQD